MNVDNALIISITTIALSSMSLIITIIGWSVTARRQKELLERQISAEHNKAKLSFSIPRQLQMIDSIREWKLEGDRVLAKVRDETYNSIDNEETLQQIQKWNERFYFYGLSEKVLLLNDIYEGDLFYLIDNYITTGIKVLKTRMGNYDINSIASELEKLDVDITEELAKIEMSLLQNK